MSEYIELAKKCGAVTRDNHYLDSDNIMYHITETLFNNSDQLTAYSEALRAKDKEELAATQLVVGQMREALEMLYDRYENGDQVTEDGDIDGCYMGKAVKLSEEEENQILRLIPSCLNDNGKSLQVSTDALREHDAKVLEEAGQMFADNDDAVIVKNDVLRILNCKAAELRATKKEN